MNDKPGLGRLRAVVYVFILMVASAVWVTSAQQQPPPSGQSSNFTGGAVTTLKGEGRISYYVIERL